MKTELEYLRLAFDVWCIRNKWSKGLPITAEICTQVLAIADEQRTKDRAAIESATS